MTKAKRYSFGGETAGALTEGSDLHTLENIEHLLVCSFSTVNKLLLKHIQGQGFTGVDVLYLKEELPEQLEAAADLLRRAGFTS